MEVEPETFLSVAEFISFDEEIKILRGGAVAKGPKALLFRDIIDEN